ncbi:DUF4422 domain-containing protein [Candidatus Saccharibacteria bacterium]|nr:DUF4422 domain-containing protein [Candidatus Saccharibacteria bacterium]
MSQDLKIFVSCHKPADFIHDDVFIPIQVGASLPNRTKIKGAIQDSTGSNISDKNPRYCELTAQYWAWKNALKDTEYIGFFHYRRYLDFSGKNHPTDAWGNIVEKFISPETINEYKLNGDTINNLVKKYDIILPVAKDVTKMPEGAKNIREQYESSGYLHAKDLDIMLEVIKEKYPEFLPYAQDYLASKTSYLNNMFIMKKTIFSEYNAWLFDILDECDKRIDYTDYSTEAIRTPGHLAERLFNIYIAYLKDHQNFKIKELPTVIFLSTDPLPDIKPAFPKNNIAIVLSADDYYVPYLATVLSSVKENTTTSNNYDVIVMTKNISLANQTRLQSIFNSKNTSLRFIDISRFEPQFKKLFLRGHFAIETWFRLLMPEIFPHYNKILYLDSDLVVNSDLAKLYNTNIQGKLLAACRDADTAGLYNGAQPDKKHYMDHILKIKKPYDYFQAGVVLFNLAEFREQYTTAEMLKFAGSYKWQLLDQDVLNFLAQEQVVFVDMSWNVMHDWKGARIEENISRAPERLSIEYLTARKNPKIIHYAGPDKPWTDPEADFAEIFWRYARTSGYYEVLVERLIAKKRDKKAAIKRTAKKVLPVNSRRGKFARNFYTKLRG